MKDFLKNDFRINLLKRSNKILERTKYDFKNYEKERHTLLEFTQKANPNYSLWEHMIKEFEAVVDLDEKVNLQKKDFDYLRTLSSDLKEQRIREDFDINSTYLFEVIDKSNRHIQFITRKNAENYIKTYGENFNKNPKITVIENKNQDLNFLLHLIERNF